MPTDNCIKHQCIKNLTHVLEAAGTNIDKVVKVNVFLANMDDFAEMNSVYTQYWGDVKPCRTYVAILATLKTLKRCTDRFLDVLPLRLFHSTLMWRSSVWQFYRMVDQ